jgi:hypothetical protein
MGLRPEDVEKLLMDVRRQRDEAETMAEHSRERLARIASGTTPLLEIDAAEVEGAADDFAAAVRQLKFLDRQAAGIRKLLI